MLQDDCTHAHIRCHARAYTVVRSFGQSVGRSVGRSVVRPDGAGGPGGPAARPPASLWAHLFDRSCFARSRVSL